MELTDFEELDRLKMIVNQTFKGGEGSGNFGHEGRPGEVGGSSSGNSPIVHGSQAQSSEGKNKVFLARRKYGNENPKDQASLGKVHSYPVIGNIQDADFVTNYTDVPFTGKGLFTVLDNGDVDIAGIEKWNNNVAAHTQAIKAPKFRLSKAQFGLYKAIMAAVK